MGELIAVLSGKGGTGKTSVCAALATSLTHLGETVLCIDCDVGLRNLDIALGLADFFRQSGLAQKRRNIMAKKQISPKSAILYRTLMTISINHASFMY